MASVHERTNTDGSLSYQVRYLEAGRQRSKTFRVAGPGPRARQTAEREASAFARAVERGEAAPDGTRLTVNDLIDRWLAAREPRVEPSTLLRYRQVTRDHVRPRLGRLRLGAVTPLTMEAWLAEQRGGGCAASTLGVRWHIAVGIFRQAVRWRLLPWNPCDGVDAPPRGAARERALSEAEVAAVLAAAVDPIDRAIVALLVGTGCRIGELVALRWTDVDLEAGTVRFAATVQRQAAGVAIRDATKSGTTRTVALDSTAIPTATAAPAIPTATAAPAIPTATAAAAIPTGTTAPTTGLPSTGAGAGMVGGSAPVLPVAGVLAMVVCGAVGLALVRRSTR